MSVVEYIQSSNHLIDVDGKSYNVGNEQIRLSKKKISIHGCSSLEHTPQFRKSSGLSALIASDLSFLDESDEIAHTEIGGQAFIFVRSGSNLFISDFEYNTVLNFELFAEDCKFISSFNDYSTMRVNILTLIGDEYFVIVGNELIKVGSDGPLPKFENIRRVRLNCIITRSGSLFRLVDLNTDNEFYTVGSGNVEESRRWFMGRNITPFYVADAFDEYNNTIFLRTFAIDTSGLLWVRDERYGWKKVHSKVIDVLGMIRFVPIVKTIRYSLQDANEEMYFEDKLGSIHKLEAIYNIQHSLSVGAIDMDLPFKLWGFEPSMSQEEIRRQ